MAVPTGTTFAPSTVPVVNGRLITVDAFLNAPERVEAAVQALAANYFIADRIYGPGGDASGGAVLYDQVAAGFYFTKGDVQAINPGNEFPLVDMDLPTPLVARTTKWGAAIQLTYEDIRRNRRDKLGDGLLRLRNTVTRKVDAVALAVLRSAPIVSITASGSWASSATPLFKDVMSGISAVKALELGYTITGAILSTATELNLTTNDKVIDAAWKSGGAIDSPLVSRQLGRLLGLNWYTSQRVSDNEVFLLAEQTAGKISDEVPLYTRVVDDPKQERKLIMAGRLTVPYVNNPKAVVRIQGMQ